VWEPTSASFPFPFLTLSSNSPFVLSAFSRHRSGPRSSPRSRSLRAQSLPRASPFFEYNLQTPLNARSRFKPPGNRRALLYQGVKISWTPREGGRGSRATLSRNSPGPNPFCTRLPPHEILTARARQSASCVPPCRPSKGPSAIRLASLQEPRRNQTA